MTPAELIKERRCTPGCLAATTKPNRCSCPCGTAYHGLTSRADITALIESRQTGRDLLGDLAMVTHAAA